MNIETKLKTKILKGNISVTHDPKDRTDKTDQWPFLNNQTAPKGGLLWLKSIRLTPEPGPKVMVHDIQIGRGSIFCGPGPFQARLLNVINTGDVGWQPIPFGQIITLVLSGDEYKGLCEIELVDPDGHPENHLTFITPDMTPGTGGSIKMLFVAPSLCQTINSGTLPCEIEVEQNALFKHQIFENERVEILTKPDSEGVLILRPTLWLEAGQRFVLSTKRVLVYPSGEPEKVILGRGGACVGLLERPTR